MRRRAVLLAVVLALATPVVIRAFEPSCNPLCAWVGRDIWNPLYWLYGCDSCPPNPPDAG